MLATDSGMEYWITRPIVDGHVNGIPQDEAAAECFRRDILPTVTRDEDPDDPPYTYAEIELLRLRAAGNTRDGD